MKEKLTIKNFGPIKHVDLELGRFTVLIGDQGTGKSTIGKILAIFNDDWFIQEPDFIRYLQSYNIDSFLNDSTEIDYSNQFVDIRYSTDFNMTFKDQNLFTSIENIKSARTKWREATDETDQLLLDELIKLRGEFEKEYFVSKYIPSERTLIGSNDEVQTSRQNQSSKQFEYLSEFESIFNSAKKAKKFDFLGNSFINEDNVWFLVKPNKNIRIKAASSGIQSSFPLGLTLGLNTTVYKKLFYVIEEPEQNLFPTSQYALTKYIVLTSEDTEHKILITTHSPYILTSLNNLLYAYKVGQTHKKEVEGIIEGQYWLNPNIISAYQLLTDGTCENIIAEDGLIMAEKIDVISKTINEEYDKILDIQYAK